ncbi:MAG: hypothetical protein P1P85_02190 [Patescibacteria group bacterium]|nr:hypothetical protein [Patescibacteria group bacterium]
MFKKIFIVILLLLTGGVLMLFAASGIVKVPVLASLLDTDEPKNLIGTVDPNLYKDVLVKGEITLTDNINKYCLTCNVTYENFSPLDITLSSAELSSLLQATNNDLGPLKHIQVKLNDNSQAEMSAYLDLNNYGYNLSGPVYASGKIFKSGTSKINIEIEKVELGILSIPDKYIKQGENALNLLLDKQLSQMSDLKIDSLEINNNSLHFKGNYPKKASTQ